MKKLFIHISLMLSLIFISGCKTINVTGNNIKDEDVQYLKSKNLTHHEVTAHLGTPSIVPSYSPNTWYYIYTKTYKTSWTLPTITEQRILKINFDSHGKVVDAVILENTHNNDITIASEITPTPGTEESAFQEFVKNIGRFKGSKKKKK